MQHWHTNGVPLPSEQGQDVGQSGWLLDSTLQSEDREGAKHLMLYLSRYTDCSPSSGQPGSTRRHKDLETPARIPLECCQTKRECRLGTQRRASMTQEIHALSPV